VKDKKPFTAQRLFIAAPMFFGAHCAFEITLSGAIMLTLLLVCAFFSTQVQKYLAWDL